MTLLLLDDSGLLKPNFPDDFVKRICATRARSRIGDVAVRQESLLCCVRVMLEIAFQSRPPRPSGQLNTTSLPESRTRNQ